MDIKEFDIVKTHFDEIGIVREVETLKPWGNMVNVEIIKTNGTFSNLGDVVEYKPIDLKIVKKLEF